MFRFINSKHGDIVVSDLQMSSGILKYYVLHSGRCISSFSKKKVTLSHSFHVNKMGKIKVILKVCQIYHLPSSLFLFSTKSLSKYIPLDALEATSMVTFCPFMIK